MLRILKDIDKALKAMGRQLSVEDAELLEQAMVYKRAVSTLELMLDKHIITPLDLEYCISIMAKLIVLYPIMMQYKIQSPESFKRFCETKVLLTLQDKWIAAHPKALTYLKREMSNNIIALSVIVPDISVQVEEMTRIKAQ